MDKLQKYIKIIWLSMALVLVFSLGFGVGTQSITTANGNHILNDDSGKVLNKDKKRPEFLSDDVDFGLFWDVWDILANKYVDKPISETDLFYGALNGLVNSVGDPYTVLFNPEQFSEFERELMNGEFEGIGAEIGIKNGVLTVISPLPESPAEQAGLKPGDKIIAVDGMDTSSMTLDFAVQNIRGEGGTTVTLLVMRGDNTVPFDIPITRDTIVVHSVRFEVKPFQGENIGYIKLLQFNDTVMSELDVAIAELLAQNVDKVILDMRNNPGGFLNVAVDVANEWVTNDPVVIERRGDGGERKYRAGLRSRLKGMKTIVLVNQGSASASEIVAGALQDYAFATIVGEQTFGKGSVQVIETLDDGSALKLTVSKWFTPNGRGIDEEGITPDIVVELTEDDYNNDNDPQLDKALELLAE